MTIPSTIRILLIEDNPADALLLSESLAEISEFEAELVHAESLADGLDLLKSRAFDVVLLDLGLPDSHGLETLTEFCRRACDLPVLVMTGLDDMSTGLQAIQWGAQDYLIKKHMRGPLLDRVIRYAIERHEILLALSRSRDQLRRLTSYLQSVRESERTRISREIHDDLGQEITGLKMDLHWLKNRIAPTMDAGALALINKRLAEAEQLADRAIGTVERIAIELRPSSLDHLGIVDALRDEARRFEERSGLRMDLELSRSIGHPNREVANTFFRIFQELLTNIARHARAKTVYVHFREEAAALIMRVKDDGVGMPSGVEDRPSSLGLLGMRERVASHHGEIRFETAAGAGTCVTVSIPSI